MARLGNISIISLADRKGVKHDSRGRTGQKEMGDDLQGGGAYTARGDDGAVEHVAATRATEDAVWLLLACGADERLIVSLIHAEGFPFPAKSFLVGDQTTCQPYRLREKVFKIIGFC
jgi:hypothetical protein